MACMFRNAFGGAYAAYNSHFTGAYTVFAMPMARISVMDAGGGAQFVFKDELRALEAEYHKTIAAGMAEVEARRVRDGGLKALRERYERELMNPNEALSLGSVSRIVMPGTSRRVLGEHLAFLMRTYTPSPMSGTQREFE